jgi:hypothetical protein
MAEYQQVAHCMLQENQWDQKMNGLVESGRR